MSLNVYSIKPFDLLAFCGSGLVSQVITLAEKITVGAGDFTHVGMAVTEEILPGCGLEKGKVYILESKSKTGPDRPMDVINGKDIMGVSLRDLEEVLQVSSSRVSWCPLVDNPWDCPEKREDLIRDFGDFFKHYHGMSYEMDAVSMTAAVFAVARPLREAKDAVLGGIARLGGKEDARGTFKGDPSDWQFCSELVARAWQAVGILPQEVNPKNVLPIDFFGNDADGMERLVAEPTDLPTHGKPTLLY